MTDHVCLGLPPTPKAGQPLPEETVICPAPIPTPHPSPDSNGSGFTTKGHVTDQPEEHPTAGPSRQHYEILSRKRMKSPKHVFLY